MGPGQQQQVRATPSTSTLPLHPSSCCRLMHRSVTSFHASLHRACYGQPHLGPAGSSSSAAAAMSVTGSVGAVTGHASRHHAHASNGSHEGGLGLPGGTGSGGGDGQVTPGGGGGGVADAFGSPISVLHTPGPRNAAAVAARQHGKSAAWAGASRALVAKPAVRAHVAVDGCAIEFRARLPASPPRSSGWVLRRWVD